MTIQPTLHCPCSGEFLTEAIRYECPPPGETAFSLPGGTYQRCYDRCGVCGHFFARHDLDLGAIYRNQYLDATYGDPEGLLDRLRRVQALPPDRSDNIGRVDRVIRFADRHSGKPDAVGRRRLLDVGAGIGVFPAAMADAGWNVTAVEPDQRTVRHLIDNAGIDAVCADFMDLNPTEVGEFDAVTLNKVLEHVEDPVAMLRQAARFLASDGFCYVEVPDVAAATQGPHREEFFIEHHHIFSPTSLALLSQQAGLTSIAIERLVEPSGKFTLRSFLLLNSQLLSQTPAATQPRATR